MDAEDPDTRGRSRGVLPGSETYSPKEGGIARRVTIYEAKDPEALSAHAEGLAKRLREDHQKHFGDESRLTGMVLEETFS